MTFSTLNLHRLTAPGRAAAFAIALGAPTIGVMAQAHPITEPSIQACAGALLDSGGEGASGYGNNESFTSTICSDQPGQSISLTWITFHLSTEGSSPGDQLTIYDGPDASAPVIGTYTGNNSPGIVSASFANTSGCLTVQFTSNEAGTGIFAATISCYVPCQPPLAVATMGVSMPNLICQDEVVNFDGSASTAAPGRTIVQYSWDFDDGSADSTSGPLASHSWHIPAEYVVELHLTDDIGCESVNLVDLQNWVSTTPEFHLTGDQEICMGTSTSFTADADAVLWTSAPHVDFGDGVALPDNVGSTFSSEITYTAFEPGVSITDINQLQTICVDMEHTFMGDLVVQIICPNGQTAIMHEQGGGGLFLGDANDEDDVDPVAGTCWHYCWSPAATNGTWAENSDNGVSVEASQGAALPPGTYQSLEPLDQLVGCPLNGTWTFNITDLWGADNGFLCAWEISFDSSLYPELTEYTPVLGMSTQDSSWWSGPGIVMDSNDHLTGTVTPTSPGSYEYIFSVIDNFGCTYTDTTSLVVDPIPQGPLVITGDQDLCSGETSVLSTTLPYTAYDWSNGGDSPTITVGGGSYTVIVGEGDCTLTSDPFEVTMHPSPQPEITGAGTNCSGQMSTLGTSQSYTTYLWSNSSNASSITVGTGTWSVIVTDVYGCSGTDDADVVAALPPTVAFSATPPSPQPPGVAPLFEDASNGNTSPITDWSWNFGEGFPGSNSSTASVTYPLPGFYPVTLVVTNSEGCVDSLTQTYIVAPGDVVVPNVFSPNGDGSNDFLEFSNAQYYPDTHLQVYNRWGQLIYENLHYQNNWNAPGVSEGTYFFILHLKDGREWTGSVTLLR